MVVLHVFLFLFVSGRRDEACEAVLPRVMSCHVMSCHGILARVSRRRGKGPEPKMTNDESAARRWREDPQEGGISLSSTYLPATR